MKQVILSLNILFVVLGKARVLSSIYSTAHLSIAPSTNNTALHPVATTSTSTTNISSTGYGVTFSSAFSSSTQRNSQNTTASASHLPTFTSSSHRLLNTTNNQPLFPTPTGIARNSSTNSTSNQCWMQWSSFWDKGNWNTSATLVYTELTYTVTSTTTQVWSVQTAVTRTQVETITSSYDMYDADFNLGPVPITSTVTNIETLSDVTEASTATQTSTMVFNNLHQVTVITHTSFFGPTPSCALPTSIPQCQTSWDTWVSNNLQSMPSWPIGEYVGGTYTPAWYTTYSRSLSAWVDGVHSPRPICTQATIDSSRCESLVDAYITGSNYGLVSAVVPEAPMFFHSAGYYGILSALTSGTPTYFTSPQWAWPTSSSVGLGCNVGCGRCAVTANSVQLLYWPQATGAPGDEPVTLETLGTTLTSPTLYVSYSKIFASDACKGLGGTYTNNIVPIPNTADFSSVWAAPIPVKNGNMQNPDVVNIYTTAFNISDLYQDPVPMSIYSSQPWCATWAVQNGAMSGSWMNITGWSCPQTRPYEPIIVIPSTILAAIDPAWASCHGALQGAYDPPSVLTPATAAASATLPSFENTAVPAAPAQAPLSNPAATTTSIPLPSPPPVAAGLIPSSNGLAIQTPALPSSNPAPTASPNPPNPIQPQAPAIVIGTIASQPLILNPSTPNAILLGDTGSTLTPSQQTTINNTPISMGAGSIVIGPNTIALTFTPSPTPIITIGGQPLIPAPSSPGSSIGGDGGGVGGIIIGSSTTLTPGQHLTLSGTPISVGESNFVIGTSTIPYPASPPAISSLAAGGFVIGTQTITPAGPGVTLGGTMFSALPGNSGVVVVSDGGRSTVPAGILPVATTGPGLGVLSSIGTVTTVGEHGGMVTSVSGSVGPSASAMESGSGAERLVRPWKGVLVLVGFLLVVFGL